LLGGNLVDGMPMYKRFIILRVKSSAGNVMQQVFIVSFCELKNEKS